MISPERSEADFARAVWFGVEGRGVLSLVPPATEGVATACSAFSGAAVTAWSEDGHKGQANFGGGARDEKMTTVCAD